MWENELIMLRFSFALLIATFILLLAILLKLYFDHRELVNVLRNLAIHSHCEDEREGDEQ